MKFLPISCDTFLCKFAACSRSSHETSRHDTTSTHEQVLPSFTLWLFHQQRWTLVSSVHVCVHLMVRFQFTESSSSGGFWYRHLWSVEGTGDVPVLSSQLSQCFVFVKRIQIVLMAMTNIYVLTVLCCVFPLFLGKQQSNRIFMSNNKHLSIICWLSSVLLNIWRCLGHHGGSWCTVKSNDLASLVIPILLEEAVHKLEPNVTQTNTCTQQNTQVKNVVPTPLAVSLSLLSLSTHQNTTPWRASVTIGGSMFRCLCLLLLNWFLVLEKATLSLIAAGNWI